jgi:hypothetical protein
MQPESSPENFAPQGRPWPWPKRAIRAFMILVPIGLLLLAVHAYVFVGGDRALQQAIAEANEIDPGWQWDDLEARRAIIPDAENGALQVLEAKRLMPDPWPVPQRPLRQADQKVPPANATQVLSLEEVLARLLPPEQLDQGHTEDLRAQLRKVEVALEVARSLADLPHGRYPGSYRWTCLLRRLFLGTRVR